jgi:hypothetical protein
VREHPARLEEDAFVSLPPRSRSTPASSDRLTLSPRSQRGADAADLRTQSRYGVDYPRYWVDPARGKIFCLVEAPDADAAESVHREAHGLVAGEIYPVTEGP